ncbi:unnamed protein product [Acanthocheilonema viteae]|uniref:Rhabdovirus nucleocapsid domain-containing protein n=1 Tax=Acanthocheilonema viteae TaxID=6277 RepID=A0A498T0S5_ACAVI|nr:unnamed protein product [Acanthocheilonema viteae]
MDLLCPISTPINWHQLNRLGFSEAEYGERGISSDSTAGVMNVPHWIQDTNYCTLVAAVDMFFRRFTNHKLEKFRACTLGSFMKDCVMLTSLNQAAQAFALNPATLVQYIYSPQIAEDVRRIIWGPATEEKNEEYSYFQYMREVNLIPRSPYSASLNPNLFNWCQFIGVLMGQRRSIYARLIPCSSPSMLLIYAAYVVYYVSGIPDARLQFADTPDKQELIMQSSSARKH